MKRLFNYVSLYHKTFVLLPLDVLESFPPFKTFMNQIIDWKLSIPFSDCDQAKAEMNQMTNL